MRCNVYVTCTDPNPASRMVLMVLELMEGGELFDRLVAVKHFTEQQARRIMKQVSLHPVSVSPVV